MRFTVSGFQPGDDIIPAAAVSDVYVRIVKGRKARTLASGMVAVAGFLLLIIGLFIQDGDTLISIGVIAQIGSYFLRKQVYGLYIMTEAGEYLLLTNTNHTFLEEMCDAIL